jgi:hypothetical protein
MFKKLVKQVRNNYQGKNACGAARKRKCPYRLHVATEVLKRPRAFLHQYSYA